MSANLDIRLSAGLPGHRKTKRLIKRLGPGAGWFLIRLFLWTRCEHPNGDLSGISAVDIEESIDWDGEPGAFVAALLDVGFLDGDASAYRVHDWAEHQPWSAGTDLRSAKARWNAVKRHHGVAAADEQVPEYAAARKAEIDSSRNANSDPQHASSRTQHAISNASSTAQDANSSATSMLAAQSSNAPSSYPSSYPSVEAYSSETGASSSASPDDQPPPAGKAIGDKASSATRLAAVTDEAIAAFNASKLVKTAGGHLAAVSATVGREKRREQVRRSLRTARAICSESYGSQTITPEFWADYWAEIERDDFLSGRKCGGPGHENWVPDFEFLTREATMLKVYDKAGSAERGAA